MRFLQKNPNKQEFSKFYLRKIIQNIFSAKRFCIAYLAKNNAKSSFFCALLFLWFAGFANSANCATSYIYLAKADSTSKHKNAKKDPQTKDNSTKSKTSQKSAKSSQTKATKDTKDSKKDSTKNEQNTISTQQKKSKLPYSKKELKELDNFLESLPKYSQKQLLELDKEREILSLTNDITTTQESKLKALKLHCQKGSGIACSSYAKFSDNPSEFQKAQKMLQKECDTKMPSAKSGLYCATVADRYLIGKTKIDTFQRACELGEALGCLGIMSAKKPSRKTKKYIIFAHFLSENLCEAGHGIYCGIVASVLSFKQVSGVSYYAKKGCEELHDRTTCLILERLESSPNITLKR